MARLLIDGFEGASFDLWDYVYTSGFSIDNTSKITGTYSAYNAAVGVGYGAATVMQKIVGTRTSLYLSFRWRPSQWPGTRGIVSFQDQVNGHQASLCLDAAGKLRAQRYSTTLAIGSYIFAVNQNYHIEIYFYLDDTNGRFVVKRDGLVEIDFTGDTKYLSTPTFDMVQFGADGINGTFTQYYDDIIFDDAAYPGNTKVA